MSHREALKDTTKTIKDLREEQRLRRELAREKVTADRRTSMGRKSLPGIPRPQASQQQQKTGQQQSPPQQGQGEDGKEKEDGRSASGEAGGEDWKQFLLDMESRMTANSNDRFEKLENAMYSNTRLAEDNYKAIRDLERKTTSLEKKTDEKIAACGEAMERKVESSVAMAMATAKLEYAAPVVEQDEEEKQPSERNISEYELCRRSLRVWPIKGPDYKKSMHHFLTKFLGLNQEQIRDLGTIAIEKNDKKNSNIEDEVVAVFTTKHLRDSVKTKGSNLADHKDAGMRIEVPGYLMGTFNLLQSVGFHLKKKDAGVRRSVKFDDEKFSLFLEAKIGGEWRRIFPAEAKKLSKSIPEISRGPRSIAGGELAALLKGDGSGSNPMTVD